MPLAPKLGVTGREIAERIGDLHMPADGFADDIEAVPAALAPAGSPEWPD